MNMKTCIVSLLLISFTTASQLVCDTLYECEDQTITGYDTVICSGQRACQGTTITDAINVTCSGLSGCKYADITAEYILCDGVLGCSYATINGASLNCIGSYGCQNSVINVSDVDCGGFAGCSVATINGDLLDNGLECSGTYSCQNSEFTGQLSSLDCSGDGSCFSLTSRSTAYLSGNLYCEEENSCYNYNFYINESINIKCNGLEGCEYNEFYFRADDDSTTQYIECNGEYGCKENIFDINDNSGSYIFESEATNGMYGSVIYSGENNNLEITLSGINAGEELDIYCQAGSTCTVTCQDEGCVASTYFYCEDDASCSYDCGNCEIAGYCLTNEAYSDKDIDFNSIKMSKRENLENAAKADASKNDHSLAIIDPDSTKKCNNIFSACSSKTISGYDTVKCTAWLVCLWSDITADTVKCSGLNSCDSTDITADDVTCSGQKSCLYAVIDVSNSLTCSGKKSCQASEKITVAYGAVAECSGYRSCRYLGANILFANIYKLRLYGELDCSGEESCEYSNIRALGDNARIRCDGYSSCYDLEVWGKTSNIEFSVSSEGERGIVYSTIYSGINNTLIVTLEGYESAVGLDVYCEEGSNCTVICNGAACVNSTFLYCDDTATCNLVCKCGDEEYCATQVDTAVTQNLIQQNREDKVLEINQYNKDKHLEYDEDIYQMHLKFGGKPVSEKTLKIWKNITSNKNKNHDNFIYLAIFGVITTIIFGSVLYKCHRKELMSKLDGSSNLFDEVTPLLL